MRIACLAKFVPDVENFIYDHEKNVLVRENIKLILNPDDACALALALKLKERYCDVFVEVISMAPLNTIPYLEDLLRRKIDKATLISDKLFAGSDTYTTSRIIARYLQKIEFDCILTGTHSLDGDTAHVPAQVAEILQINHMSNIIKLDVDSFSKESAVVEVDFEKKICKYQIMLPAVLSIQKESKYKLPFVKYKDLNLDVSDKISIVTNEDLGFSEDEVGLEGSLTKVVRTFVKKIDKKEKVLLSTDDKGIEAVYQFLKAKGFV